MSANASNAPKLRFGVFELDLEEGELRKRGMRVSLQEQPFRLLCLLLERPGQVICRDELRARIWPADTFVEFDGSLNIAVLKVRQALGDSASHPRFIETVPRRGYRFIAPVDTGAAELDAQSVERPQPSEGKRSVTLWIAVAAAAAVIGAGELYRVNRGSTAVYSPPVPLPVTAFPGIEANPALSPDGTQVAFIWNGEKNENFDLYVSDIPPRDAPPLRLTASAADEISPAWSPDGNKIAFLRRLTADSAELIVMPSSGGPEHKVANILNREIGLARLNALAWAPDGQSISVSHRGPGKSAPGIVSFSLTGTMRQLTDPPSHFHGDYMPSYSPDGNYLAFCRLPGFSTSEIYLLPLKDSATPRVPVGVTTARRWSAKPVWSSDSRSLLYLFSEHPETRHGTRMLDLTTTPPTSQILPIPDELTEIAAVKGRLVYSRRIFESNIWRARIPPPGKPPAVAEPFLSSTRSDEKPSYSPDGTKIAFVSKRSGSDEIWVASSDGTNAARMTHLGGPLVGAPNWSPDGKRIVFHARPEGQADLFFIPAAGGSPVRLTTDPSDDVMPSYSRDGGWIYFASRRSGEVTIWKMPSAGGEAQRLAHSGGGTKPVESFDGKSVYYHTWPTPDAILKIPATGGHPVKTAGPTHDYPLGFAITGDGIYYPAPPHRGPERHILFFRFSTGQTRPVVIASHPFRLGMSVSPDDRFIAFDQADETGSDIMLIENFAFR